MPLWQPEMAVGDPIIDQQHKAICDFMDVLLVDVRVGKPRFPEALEFLRGHFTSHFAVEEEFMREEHYPGYDYHHGEHLQFFDVFVNLKAHIESGGPTIHNVRRMTHALADWMNYHVAGCDRLLADWLRSRRS
jgi:hemerythrin